MTPTLDIAAIYRPRNQQRIFRKLLDAMSRPGTIVTVSPWAEPSSAHMAVLATLADAEVTLADADGLIDEAAWRFLDCRRGDVASARFVLAAGSHAPAADFTPQLGTLTSPELGATLVLTVAGLGQSGSLCRLSGPGIAGHIEARLGTLHKAWIERRGAWNRFFPMGVDMVLADQNRVLALPRTTRLVHTEVKP